MASVNIRPLEDKILVQANEAETTTASARSTFCVVQATDRVALAPIVVGRYYDTFARDGDGWFFTERIADVEMVGDVSDHLLIDPHHG